MLGVEGEAFFLERDSTHFRATSEGTQLLAIPYTDSVTDLPASNIIAGSGSKGSLSGGFVGYSRIQFYGQQLNLVGVLADGAAGRVEVLAGIRFLQMQDRFDLDTASYVLPAQTTLFGLENHFRTHTNFYGGQLGLRGILDRGPWSVKLRGLMAMGSDDQWVRVFGAAVEETPLTRTVEGSALFVQDSNRGTFQRTVYDMVFEAGVNLSFQATRHINLFAGYTFLWWLNPIRAGDQVDTVINAGAGGPARPLVPFREDSFWAHGINAGVLFSW
jgi:hypothetical protein